MVIVIFLFLLKTQLTYAWGAEGHKIVAQIVKHYLNNGVEDSVKKYLGSMSFLQTANESYQSSKNPNCITIKTS